MSDDKENMKDGENKKNKDLDGLLKLLFAIKYGDFDSSINREFLGGPLDGAIIKLDVLDDNYIHKGCLYKLNQNGKFML